MGKLRDDTKQIVEELTQIGQRFGMATDPSLPPERQADIGHLTSMSIAGRTSAMSISMVPERSGEMAIPVTVTFVSPPEADQPQAAQFTRMMADILSKNGVRSERTSFGEKGTDRVLKFTATSGNAAQLANALTEINQFMETNQKQEEAVRNLLTKASAIEKQYTDDVYSHATKVSPTFEITKIKDEGKEVIVPVFGATIETSDYPLMDGLAGAKSKTPGIQITEGVTFNRVDIGKREFTGNAISAKGKALEAVMEVATRSRDDLVQEQDQLRYSQVMRGEKPDPKSKPSDKWSDDLGGDANHSIGWNR